MVGNDAGITGLSLFLFHFDCVSAGRASHQQLTSHYYIGKVTKADRDTSHYMVLCFLSPFSIFIHIKAKHNIQKQRKFNWNCLLWSDETKIEHFGTKSVMTTDYCKEHAML